VRARQLLVQQTRHLDRRTSIADIRVDADDQGGSIDRGDFLVADPLAIKRMIPAHDRLGVPVEQSVAARLALRHRGDLVEMRQRIARSQHGKIPIEGIELPIRLRQHDPAKLELLLDETHVGQGMEPPEKGQRSHEVRKLDRTAQGDMSSSDPPEHVESFVAETVRNPSAAIGKDAEQGPWIIESAMGGKLQVEVCDRESLCKEILDVAPDAGVPGCHPGQQHERLARSPADLHFDSFRCRRVPSAPCTSSRSTAMPFRLRIVCVLKPRRMPGSVVGQQFEEQFRRTVLRSFLSAKGPCT
jgi:hypothetical protein